ncbi:type II toxin-antitoxin system VapC family toxin [Microbacterium sp. KUDC0406]|nr:type II toxin-antitoxin system VapC family toxin [Microbacterium sp. KUDC0406]
MITSALTRVEASRALLRRKGDLAAGFDRAFRDVLHGMGQSPITDLIIEFARTVGPAGIRSLDAIHLATATAFSVHEFWTYDDRLAEAVRGTGIPVRMPGRDSIGA